MLENLRRWFEETDSRTTGEVAVSWVRVGVGLSMVAVLATGREMRYYPGTAWTVLWVAIGYSWLALAEVAREASRGEISRWTAYGLTALDAGFIVALTGLTGTATSPVLPILVLVVISQAVRFTLRRALIVAALTASVLVPVILWTPQPALAWGERIRQAGWWAWMLVGGALLAGVLSYAADLAHRRRARAEAETVAEHRRLEEERSLRQRLEALDDARKDFLLALSHDFRTPIASLELLARAMSRSGDGALSAQERAEMLDLVGSHARHLGAMLGEVREVAVTESLGADQGVSLGDVYLPELVASAASAAGLSPERLVTSIESGLTVLRTDDRKTSRILTNLLDNARRHSPPDQPVELRVARRQGMVELAVLDRGPGIPPELASRAFDKFVGFGQHRSSGLGMWIVSQFVTALGGRVVIEPRPRGGLIVRVRLPLEEGTAVEEGSASAEPQRREVTSGQSPSLRLLSSGRRPGPDRPTAPPDSAVPRKESDRPLPPRFLSQIRAGVGTYMLVLAALGDRHFTYYPLAAWILLLTAVGYAWVVLILLSAGRMRHLPPWLPRAMTAIDTVLIAALAGVTGGAQSPAAPVLLLVVLAVAMRFRLRIGLTALAWTIPILVAGILFVPLPSRSGYERILDALWWTGNLTAAVLGPGVLSNRLQLASRRRAEAQAEAQVEHQRVAHEQLLRHHVETMEADRREYLSAVVHDCRPPVSSLESLCRGLGRDWEQLSGEEQAEILERIQGHARHLDFMLRELAEVIVSESLGAEHRAERADIPVSELLASAAATAGLPDERVVATVEPDLRVLRTDPGKCVRIIANLLEDAASHSPGGEPVEVHVGRMNGVVELSVADRRVEPGPDGSGERDGPGLGLWIASRFTEALGGAMESEPRPGGGLLLRVRFPA